MNNPRHRIRSTHPAFLFPVYCLLLTAFFALSLSQLTTTSPTFDEGYTILRGYAALRTGHIVPIGHPPLAHWLSALGVTLEPGLPDPRSLDGWYGDKYDDSSRDLLWHRGLNATRIVFLSRFPILLLGLVLGVVTARWAMELFGWRGALVALALHALSPNLLAHSALATTDLPVAAFYVFTLYRWHRYTLTPSLPNTVLVGFFLGLALAAKFNALLLLPALGILFSLTLFFNTKTPRHQDTKNHFLSALVPSCLRGLLILATALITLWANYGFALNPYPLAQYVRELTDLTSLASGGHTAYLLGQLSLNGWWYYHIVVLAVKTPLPLIVLMACGSWRIAYSVWLMAPRQTPISTRSVQSLITNYHLQITNLLLPPLLYLLATVTIFSLNVGYRYLLPALPLLHILAALVVGRKQEAVGSRFPRHLSLFILLLFIFHSVSTFSAAPHFLAYFNELVGPANGYKVLSDSNLDWGQDLPALARYLNGRPVYFSYFGQADPAYYGIKSAPLPAWPPPAETRFAPADPAPGLYAISASNLVGVQLDDPNTFAYFRDLEPLAVVNYSIFIYEVSEHDPVTAFAQCAPPILNQNAVARLLDNRAVREITFDCQNSLVVPAQPALWLYPEEQSPILALEDSIFDWQRADGSAYYRLYRAAAPELAGESPNRPITPYLSLLEYTLAPDALTLTWRVDEPAPPPVSIFVHFNWPDGALAEAYDALGFPAEQWQRGDVIIQRHPISPDLPPGQYPIVVGLYSLADGARYSEINLTTYTKP